MGWREKGRPAEHAKNWMSDPWAWRPRWCGKRMTKGGWLREPTLTLEFFWIQVRDARNIADEPPTPRAKRARMFSRRHFWNDCEKQKWRSWKHYRSTQYKVVRMT